MSSETDMPKRSALVEFMKRISPIRSEPLATAVAEEWADNFVEEFYPEAPKPGPSASDYYSDFQSEAVDAIQSALFERAGWSSEDYSREFGKYRYDAEDIASKLFGEATWTLLGFSISDLEARNAD